VGPATGRVLAGPQLASERKSGMPDSVEIPAPEKTTIRRAAPSSPAASSSLAATVACRHPSRSGSRRRGSGRHPVVIIIIDRCACAGATAAAPS
jgi:hypothetical protein